MHRAFPPGRGASHLGECVAASVICNLCCTPHLATSIPANVSGLPDPPVKAAFEAWLTAARSICDVGDNIPICLPTTDGRHNSIML